MIIPEFFERHRPHCGMTAEEYRRFFEQEAANVKTVEGLRDDDPRRYLKLNLQRTKRIEKNYVVSERVQAAARAVSKPQIWMVLTEPWCGDCAQNLPYIVKIASLNSAIEPRILLRDQNAEIMEAYLTDGARSIPKLVAFDLSGRELFRWGPRPQPAADLFCRLRTLGAVDQEVRRDLHLWYARDRGRALETEFLALLTQDREDRRGTDSGGPRGTDL